IGEIMFNISFETSRVMRNVAENRHFLLSSTMAAHAKTKIMQRIPYRKKLQRILLIDQTKTFSKHLQSALYQHYESGFVNF
ncbi:hypothetical protein L9F63_013286, partial [Diploptera punctata]